MKAVFAAAVLLAADCCTCLAFLPPLASLSPSARSPRVPAASTGLDGHLTPPRARCRDAGRSSCGSSRRVLPRRSRIVLSAAAGEAVGDGSVDIFDALQAGDMAFVKEYVKGGGDCAVQDSIGDTPLMVAVESELATAVKILIKEGGADANRASEATGETPLMLAAYYGYTELVRVLIEEGGAQLESRNRKGQTALSLACFWGNEDTVKYLLEAGADPDSLDESGERPGDSFDAVFVPEDLGNFSAVDGGGEGQDNTFDEDEDGDIMFDELDEEEKDEGKEKDAMLGDDDGLEDKKAGGDEEDKTSEGGGGEERREDGGEEEELGGPREVILGMLEEARAKASAQAAS